jgi:hypothetical protein
MEQPSVYAFYLLCQAFFRFYSRNFGGVACIYERQWIHELPDNLADTMTKIILSESTVDSELAAYSRLRLLVVHWAAQALKQWAGTLRHH